VSIATFSGTKRTFPFAIFIYYWPIGSAFVAESDCRHVKNKFDCAFLRMTNCTIPKFISDCVEEECLKKSTKEVGWAIASDKTTLDGNYVEDMRKVPLKINGHQYQLRLSEEEGRIKLKFAKPHQKSLPGIEGPDSFFSMFNYLFMTRPNAFFRAQMKKLVHEMRSSSKPHFHPHTPCVAVHIRRGDRIVPGVNMTEFCANATYDENPEHTVKRGCVELGDPRRLGKCNKVMDYQDYNCHRIPFDAVKLHHIIDKVPRLIQPTIYDLVVFSDDPFFLDDEIKELAATDPRWRIHTLPSPKIPSTIDMSKVRTHREVYLDAMNRIRHGGTDSGVFFQSSLHLAQQCSAFIAHYGSGVASLFYHAMCAEHAGRYGVCPPTYDMRVGL
jgi:hypothetical protein